MPEVCAIDSINKLCRAVQIWYLSKREWLFLLTETSGMAGAFLGGERNYRPIGLRRYRAIVREIDGIVGVSD
jgi:hypothetical protein